ncbi:MULTISPECIES: NUDIX domain-containing protein [unclassified Mesorhizobium]|uniref:NUDIX domain-containing protein n=1 Tax=unclassified Mesorhizobium TaxID=325217 RepID=UPI000FD8D3C4|nr:MULTISPECIES: NUDIX domain-containing protein [unclassified Mesorhizobium]TGQ41943.1 NUDIX domain-containing protein [Mesorhizobium sp. M00.F.Ca.ET.216.01.1.1]TIS54045.1 MAG: NUDIX domain-containing protein [Mesorhizobium sp.]TIS90587.1 MAG: NUDIX domain-containing protein [Mesorhizobium sp.]TJW04710.1 MAG: NUDIX domain-containing protein [Mesorhizobium sp.]TJW42262.1 MAG: NUDIX domain-containing protein [Mesorhizobium sp.]
MAKRSAGILPYRKSADGLEVLLVHPGGPFWQKRDLGAWSIAKGEYGDDEQTEAAARREFAEETGWEIDAVLQPLGELRQRGGKLITAFGAEADFNASALRSNVFEMEWPPRSGRMQSFPEIDRGEWFGLDMAREKMLVGQRPFLDRLVASVRREPDLH